MDRPLLTISLVCFLASGAIAQPKQNNPQKAEEKKTKEVLIKELDEAKKALHSHEKATLQNLDARAEFIVKHLDPKLILQHLETAAVHVKQTHELISVGEFDYGGNRGAAQKSLELAEHHLHETIKHNSHEQRKLAAEHVLAAHTNVQKALAFSIEKYGLGANTTVKPTTEPESRAAANRQLSAALPNIEFTYHLLAATDHEIKDYHEEKKVVLRC